MALDKLVDSTQLDNNLTSVANAIRAKSGGTGQLAFPAGFVSEIGNIPTGGGGNDFAEFVARTPTTYNRSDITKIGNAAFSEYSTLTSAIFPNVTEIGKKTFYQCTNLSTLRLHGLLELPFNSTAFYCVPAALAFPNATGSVPMNCFSSSKCPALDFGVGISSVANASMAYSSLLSVLVLRSTTLASLENIGAFNNTPFASGKEGGALYVPSALISTYQSATNWSTILGYTNNQIKSIESTHTDPNAPIDLTLYYADGTPIT